MRLLGNDVGPPQHMDYARQRLFSLFREAGFRREVVWAKISEDRKNRLKSFTFIGAFQEVGGRMYCSPWLPHLTQSCKGGWGSGRLGPSISVFVGVRLVDVGSYGVW